MHFFTLFLSLPYILHNQCSISPLLPVNRLVRKLKFLEVPVYE
ncbi:hypothetical protein Holit_02065 [Hollandina sp. SP2]